MHQGGVGGGDAARSVAALVMSSSPLAVTVLPGCGGSGTKNGSGPTTLDATFAAFPDYLDPALSYSQEGWTSMWETYVPLLTYRHASGEAGTEVIPGLAKAMPKITNGGRTYTLALRPGLRYSDGTPVRASDFRATIERDLAMNSPGSAFYTDIVGAERFAETKAGGIAGIVTDDRSGSIVIHLVHPRSTFVNELAMLFAAPLPAGTKREDLSKTRRPAPAHTRSSKPSPAPPGATGATRNGPANGS